MPLYEQLAGLLRAQIESGEITGKLPSVKALMQTHGLGSQDTVLKALALLREAGLVTTVPRRGTYVTKPL